MDTELGRITHNYWWNDGVYHRRHLQTGALEKWTGKGWEFTGGWQYTPELRKAA